MQSFEYRKAYARKSETFLKKFVLARTTNEVRHLKTDQVIEDLFQFSLMENGKRNHPLQIYLMSTYNKYGVKQFICIKVLKIHFYLVNINKIYLKKIESNFGTLLVLKMNLILCLKINSRIRNLSKTLNYLLKSLLMKIC